MSVLNLIPEDKRKELDSSRKESLENVYSSSRLTLLQKRKKLSRLLDMSNASHQTHSSRDKYITQRVLSAKTHRVKQLQNQLADAHFHLQELSNENRILRVMQKKHEIALSRYENSTAELPLVLNSHTEEMRVQTAQYKQLKVQYKETSNKLKERDLQLQQLKDEHQHLLDMTKDRNLPERCKLQARVSELEDKVMEQNETISKLQRRIALENKSWRQRLAKQHAALTDTRNDLDQALTNADKLTTIIEMKEKMLHSASNRRSPVKGNFQSAPTSVQAQQSATQQRYSAKMRTQLEQNGPLDSSRIAKFCESSRNLSSALSREDDTTESIKSSSRMRSFRSRSNSSRTTPNQTRKNSKESDSIIELGKTVEEGMAELNIDEIVFQNTKSQEVQKKIETMKQELLEKIKNNEDPETRIPSSMKRYSIGDSDDDLSDIKEIERPKSRSFRSSNVSFFGDVTVDSTSSALKTTSKSNGVIVGTLGSGDDEHKKETVERKLSGKSVDKYCKTIIKDIENSSKVIDKHVQEFNNTQFESEKLVQQLEAVDKISSLVSNEEDIKEETLIELNNNLKVLTNQVADSVPVPRKRSITSRRTNIADIQAKNNLFGDSSMTNQDLLNDLLGRK